MRPDRRDYIVHVGLIAALLAAHFLLPLYHHGVLARIMVLAVFAMAYNLAFGYAGLLSLGHALYFAAGMYGMGLAMQHGGLGAGMAVLIGLASALAVSLLAGILALRTADVALMIVTLMFAQAGYLTVLYAGEWTRGDEGFIIPQAARRMLGLDLSDENTRYLVALVLFSVVLLGLLHLVRSPFGHVLVAIRENPERTRMLGYDVARYKLVAFVISGGISGLAGAAYGVMFGYVGAGFAAVPYSILPLLWVLLGGAGTILGPFVGTLFMFYLIDIASGFTPAYMIFVGVALVFLTLFARGGIVGELRTRFAPWLP